MKNLYPNLTLIYFILCYKIFSFSHRYFNSRNWFIFLIVISTLSLSLDILNYFQIMQINLNDYLYDLDQIDEVLEYPSNNTKSKPSNSNSLRKFLELFNNKSSDNTFYNLKEEFHNTHYLNNKSVNNYYFKECILINEKIKSVSDHNKEIYTFINELSDVLDELESIRDNLNIKKQPNDQ